MATIAAAHYAKAEQALQAEPSATATPELWEGAEMSTKTITVPEDGAVLVITADELSALRAMLYGIDVFDLAKVLTPAQQAGMYQLAREVRDI